MNDYLVKGMAYNNEVRFFAAYTKETCEEARRIHNTSPVASAALGRALTGGAMMGSMCKNDSDLLTLKFAGDGPARGITVTADSKARVKGIIYNNDIELPLKANGHLDVGTAVGHGYLSVIKDIGLKDPYVGQTALVTGEIAEDLTYYFAESEQIPTVVGLGVLVDTDLSIKQAGGFIIQLMPFASEETISSLERSIAEIKSVTDFYEKQMTPEQIMEHILGEVTFEEKMPVEYYCNCSRQRVTKALISVGKKDLDDMINDGEPVNLHCDFCGKDYTFEVDELKELREKAF